jgi:hypothetical protein
MMTSVLAHKQTDPAKKPGQIKNDITLGDYIERKEKAYTPKMTFNKWWRQNYKAWLDYDDYSNLQDDLAKAVWKAAQENM